MRRPLISIVMATCNAAGSLPRCLDSIRRQTFRDLELIVMDGASTDGTVDLLQRSGDIVTNWRSERDSGIYSAWNKALTVARGEWICFLGADDWLWDEGALERLVPHLRAALPGCRVVYSRVRQVHGTGEVVEEFGKPWEVAKPAFRSYLCLPHPGLMHHRSLFEQHGRFDERFRFAADYEFLWRELKSNEALFVPSLTVGMQYGGSTTTPANLLTLLQETKLALAMHGAAPPRLRWAYWTFCAWFFTRLQRVLGERAARRLADLYRLLSLRRPRYSKAGASTAPTDG